ncbi:unnamed protein product [Rotaria socialis]|uniref:SAP domain-containing protein n=1 Tax=Rotaria socialis TaxID=392032 RepID=A0A820FBX1_9BILA|nr:unnamed protein product [Rotaria socialis]CAF4259211.1 unnamed protein product [Rotaria socialis]
MASNNNKIIDEGSITQENDYSPQQAINEQSLREDLEKNRELLKRKLQTRRSFQQLVDVGIMPATNVSLAFYQKRKQLQMRKTQDILKNKILLRPNRQLLIEHNILSDTTASPAIQRTQCKLKRARLVDNLNNKLSVRPGILELVANNIFKIDSNVKQAIQDGYIRYPSLSRPLRQKVSSFSNTTIFKRSLNSIPKSKSCLTFHEYKGPLKKVEISKVPLHAASKPLEHNQTSSENHYRIQLRQQQLFLELIRNDKSTGNSNNLIGSSLQQSIDNIQSFETMKLADLKSECKKLNIGSSGTKMKLIEKLKNARTQISAKTMLPSDPINSQSLPSPVQFLLPSSLSDQELHHHQQQEQNLIEVENQLETLKQYESSLLYSNQSSSTFQSSDNSNMILQQCNSILLPQTPNQVLIEQQDKSKQNLQQHTSVPLTPESVAQYLAQPQTSDNHSLSTYHSILSLSTQSFTNQTTNNDVSFNLLDDYNVPDSYDDSNLNKVISTCITDMDWIAVPSPSLIDNNLDFTQFFNQLDTDHCQHHHLPFDSAFQQNTLFFDTFSASNPMIEN